MSGTRLFVGAVVMGVALPATLFFRLKLTTGTQFLILAAATFVTWGVADLLSQILERPRLKDRTPGKAMREETDRRSG